MEEDQIASPESTASRCSDVSGRFAWVDPLRSPLSDQMRGLLDRISQRDPDQPEFLQAIEEVLLSLRPVFEKDLKYLSIMETLVEPERVIIFRVPWLDDHGVQRVNRGFRIQYNSALGPYKGGLRFHPNVTLGTIKFLGFEQILKNSLTTLALGGGKGGSDFDPKGKSDAEVLRFCQSFMTSLARHIGPNVDVPAGDIGVGARELGYLYGQYKRMTSHFEGVLTGKDPKWGGSYLRPEATGYGAVYFAENVLSDQENPSTLKGKKVLLSGSGNVAQYACEKLLQIGATVLTLSDSSGFVLEPQGFDPDKLQFVLKLKNVDRGRISDYCRFSKTAKFFHGKKPWDIPCDIAMPCATQNEITATDVQILFSNGCRVVVEGSNMSSTNDAINLYKKHQILFCPAKAANAGGVAVSGLEMSQNSQRETWTREMVDEKLKIIMHKIYCTCRDSAVRFGLPRTDIQAGANIAGFLKVADAMVEQGCV